MQFVEPTQADATTTQKLAATFLPCYAYFSIMGIPMIFGGLIDTLQVSPAVATYATTAQVAAMSAASLLVSIFLHHFQLRLTSILGLLLVIVGQTLTLQVNDLPVVILARGLIGFGEGMCVGLGLACLAQVRGGARYLSHVGGATALFTWVGFLAVPKLHQSLGSKAIFWYGLVWAVACLAVAAALPARRLDRKTQAELHLNAFLDRRNVALFALLIISCIGSCACWLYFEKVGEAAGLDLESVGLAGSFATLASATAPFLASFVFDRWKSITPMVIATTCMGVCAYFYVNGNAKVFCAIVVLMSFIFVFLLAYGRLYSAEIDPSGRATAFVGGTDAIGLLVGPLVASALLDLTGGFKPLGEMGAIFQFMCIVPALLLAANRVWVARPAT